MEFYIGQIILFGGNFAIRNFALANGQLMPISDNTALFSILGTTYGGDGRTTYALPDLRGRAPVSEGTGPGLSPYSLGEKGGAESHVLSVAQLPAHNHNLSVNVIAGNEDESNPGAGVLCNSGADNYTSSTPDGTYGGAVGRITNTGGGQAVSNLQPYLTINYEVCLQGIYPSRN